jgi:hypothetical protein
MLPVFFENHWLLSLVLQGVDISSIPPDIIRALTMSIISIFAAITGVDVDFRFSDDQKHAQMAIIWIRFFFFIDPQTEDYNITPICLALANISLSKATFHQPLVHFLENIHTHAKKDFYMTVADDILQLEGMVLNYLSVCPLRSFVFLEMILRLITIHSGRDPTFLHCQLRP